MAAFSLGGVRLSTLAVAVPSQTKRNIEYEHISPSERSVLIKTIGIEERRIVSDNMTASDLCAAAAEQLLEQTATRRKDIGLLVFVSQSPDYYLPATAALLQHRLNLPIGTLAFDVGLGCSGYVYGLSIVASLMRTTGVKKALLLAGDVSSVTTGPADKSTHPLFGDAGSASLLELDEKAHDWHVNLMTDGKGGMAIMIPDGGGRNKLSPDSFDLQPVSEGIARSRLSLTLDGPKIFAFSVREVPSSITDLLAQAGQPVDDIDYLVMHQANKLINETVRKKLKVPTEKVPYSLDKFGNTSSASIPLTLVTRLAEPLKQPQNLLLSGFGVGFSWGNVLMKTDGIQCLPLIEI